MNRKAIVMGHGVQTLDGFPGIVRSIGDKIWLETFGGNVLAVQPSRLTAEKFDDRVRFNWGFHDAAAAVRAGQAVKTVDALEAVQDQAYAVGYARGLAFARANLETSSSDPAWSQLEGYRAALPAWRRANFRAVLEATANVLPRTPAGRFAELRSVVVLLLALMVPSLAIAGEPTRAATGDHWVAARALQVLADHGIAIPEGYRVIESGYRYRGTTDETDGYCIRGDRREIIVTTWSPTYRRIRAGGESLETREATIKLAGVIVHELQHMEDGPELSRRDTERNAHDAQLRALRTMGASAATIAAVEREKAKAIR